MENVKVSTEILHKEIDLIQANITRMANNSFLLKGWFISLVIIALTLLLSQGCSLELVGLFLFITTIEFWGLDAFFLKTETLYRWKYEWIIEERLKGNTNYLYNLNPKLKLDRSENNDDCIFLFAVSKTLMALYGVPLLISIIIIGYCLIN